MQTLPISERPPPKDAPGPGDGAFLRQLSAPHRLGASLALAAAVALAAHGVARALAAQGNRFAAARALVLADPQPGALEASPAAAALLRALAALPLAAGAALLALLALLALGASAKSAAALAAGPPGRAIGWLVWLPAALLWWPLAFALREGELEPLFVAAALFGARAATRRAAGATGRWLGIAAALRPAAAVLLVHDAARGGRRSAAGGALVAAALTLVGAFVLGPGDGFAQLGHAAAGLARGPFGLAGVALALVALVLLGVRGRSADTDALVRGSALAMATVVLVGPEPLPSRSLWLLLPLAAVAHAALDPTGTPLRRRVGALGLLVAGAALAAGPLLDAGGAVAAVALVLVLALASDVTSRSARGTSLAARRA